MGLLARSSQVNSTSGAGQASYGGYISKFLDLVLAPSLDQIVKKKVKILTNAGGLNPVGLKNAIESLLVTHGLQDELTVAAVSGDDILSEKDTLASRAAFEEFDPLSGLDLKEEGIGSRIPLSLNTYLGAEPITEALKAGASIVVTGRCVDSALVVGPLAFEYGWAHTTERKSLQALASASLAGHIIECGVQITGGNYTDWRVSAFSAHGGWLNIGYPILTFNEDNSFTISKSERTGGVADRHGICEQVLYEVLGPGNYVLPDVVVDMTEVSVEAVRPGLVLIRGAKGKPITPWLKCTAVEQRGYRLTLDILVRGEEAESKGKALGEAIIGRTNMLAAARYPGVSAISAKDSSVILTGARQGLSANMAGPEMTEVALRIAARHQNYAMLGILSKATAHFFLINSCPGIFLFTSERPKSSPNFIASSILVSRDMVYIGKN